ncbi:helix-turn-helix domain-containing protein [Streptomyces sp. NPDC001914]|uniref:helix-turn-helix domain-containing protein n=1 Tax=Streptomyces sp. NPDC001914 TaxID=3364623 RepID=UPI003684AEC6
MSSRDDVEEFAALLRRLKAGSDRSYAALARHLNMNASTLHRYCAGEAVPLGFASVERFAALCGADPAERVELHRLWILAVAARQRSRAAGAAAGPSGPPAPEPDSSGSSGSSGSEPASAGTPSSAEAAGTADGAGAALTPGSGPAPAGASAPESGPDAAGAPAPTGEPEADGTLPPVTDLGSAPGERSARASLARPGAPRTRRFKRRVAVTAAVVTALVATLGSLSALPSGHSSKDAGDRVVGAPTSKAARKDSATPSTSPSATRGRPSGSPSPSPSDGRTGSPSASASPSPAGVSAGPPLTWSVNSHRWAVGCGHVYVIDKGPEQVPPPPAPQDASPWARTQNAVHGGETLVDITVQGRTDAAVVLEALRVKVVGRSAPMKGTAYSTGGGCGGDVGLGAFSVDLDEDRPVARPVPVDDGTGTRTLEPPFRVSVKEPQFLMVDALTEGCDCRWYLELDWSSRGRRGTVRIDDQGAPFRTSGIKGLPFYWYRENGWTRESL